MRAKSILLKSSLLCIVFLLLVIPFTVAITQTITVTDGEQISITNADSFEFVTAVDLVSTFSGTTQISIVEQDEPFSQTGVDAVRYIQVVVDQTNAAASFSQIAFALQVPRENITSFRDVQLLTLVNGQWQIVPIQIEGSDNEYYFYTAQNVFNTDFYITTSGIPSNAVPQLDAQSQQNQNTVPDGDSVQTETSLQDAATQPLIITSSEQSSSSWQLILYFIALVLAVVVLFFLFQVLSYYTKKEKAKESKAKINHLSKDVDNFVKQQKGLGKSNGFIVAQLLEKGYELDEINEAFKKTTGSLPHT